MNSEKSFLQNHLVKLSSFNVYLDYGCLNRVYFMDSYTIHLLKMLSYNFTIDLLLGTINVTLNKLP